MSPRPVGFRGRHIVVADENKAVVGLVIATLLAEGHAVFYAYDGLRPSSWHSASRCVISSLYLAASGRSTPDLEARLPHDVPILREPFTPDQLLAAVRYVLL